MKFRSKLIIASSLFATLTVTTAYLSSCTTKDKIQLPNTHVWANLYDNEINNFNYYENDFLADIQNLANDDSVIFYDISWAATLHKYVPIAHLLKVLEFNPNKEIYLYINNYVLDSTKIDLLPIKQKYPNFNYKFYDGLGTNSSNDYIDFNIQVTNEIMNDIKQNKLENRNKNLFTADYTMLRAIHKNINVSNQSISGLLNNFLPLLEFQSINLISDGTASTTFFNDEFFSYLSNKRIYEYDLATNSYENSKKIIQHFMSLSDEEKSLFLQNNEYDIKPVDILMMFNTTSVGNKDNKVCKVNFYFPSLNSIIDVNSIYSSNLTLNHKTEKPLFFNPYLTKNLNFIGLFRILSKDSISQFYNVLKIEESTDLTSVFNNNYNLVIAGNLITSDSVLQTEIKKIIAIYKMNEFNAKELNLKIKIWYKAHPRESENYKNTLIQKLNEEGYSDIAYSLDFLNKKLPFELLASTDYFIEDHSNKRYIGIYTGFSTISLLMDADNKTDLIKKVIVDNDSLNSIKERFGTSDESKIFNSSKIIHVDELYNSYNYLTKTNSISSYAFYKNQFKISYKTFELYDFLWQNWSNMKFDIIFKIKDKEYLFGNCLADNKKSGGINISNMNDFKKMLEENAAYIQNYNLENWNNNSITKNLFSYMNNIIDLNDNASIKPNNFLSCTIKINYKLNNKTTPFIQESGFVIFV